MSNNEVVSYDPTKAESTIRSFVKSADVPGLQELMEFAFANDFLKAPASKKYHCNNEGGLAEHSLNVLQSLGKLIEPFHLNRKSVIICGLFHDIHKCTDGFGNPQYVPETRDWHRKNVAPYAWNTMQVPIQSEIKSAMMISRFIHLRADEMQAILYHHGGFSTIKDDISSETYALTIALHFADMYSAFVTERKADVSEASVFLGGTRTA